MIVAFTGVCEGGTDERVRPNTPPKIGGRLSNHRERRGVLWFPYDVGLVV
jgi:hypothetical protein